MKHVLKIVAMVVVALLAAVGLFIAVLYLFALTYFHILTGNSTQPLPTLPADPVPTAPAASYTAFTTPSAPPTASVPKPVRKAMRVVPAPSEERWVCDYPRDLVQGSGSVKECQ